MGTCILTIYAPMIYTAPCIMFWMRAYPVRGKWEGVGPWHSRVFWALWNGIEPIGECHLGPKKLDNSRAQPPPTSPCKYWKCTHQKHYAQGCINHRFIGGLWTRAHEGGFRAHTEEGGGEVHNGTTPHNKTYEKSRDNCKVHNMHLRCIKYSSPHLKSRRILYVFIGKPDKLSISK